jgi:hypothetical protein
MSNERVRPSRFIWQRLDNIERLLADLRKGIELMAQQTVVRQSEFEQLKYQVASFSEAMNELEQRVISLEKHNSVVRLWTRIIAQVLLATLAAFLTTRFF